MDIKIREFRSDSHEEDIAKIVSLWNSASDESFCHFPVTSGLLISQLLDAKRFRADCLLFAEVGGKVVGMLHYDIIREQYYENAAVIEVVLVDKEFRRQGVAPRLMQEALDRIAQLSDIKFVDGGGSWPYSPFYSTILDGSERSGPFLSDTATLELFKKFGFTQDRKSLVMEWTGGELPVASPNTYISSRMDQPTWLDFVFRRWKLFDHGIVDNCKLMSRCIYARMDGRSGYINVESYAIFGVNTPPPYRGKGWATKNMCACLGHLQSLGAKLVQLHVYSDNEPAIKLYKRLGFKIVAETVMLRKGG